MNCFRYGHGGISAFYVTCILVYFNWVYLTQLKYACPTGCMFFHLPQKLSVKAESISIYSTTLGSYFKLSFKIFHFQQFFIVCPKTLALKNNPLTHRCVYQDQHLVGVMKNARGCKHICHSYIYHSSFTKHAKTYITKRYIFTI